MKNSKKLLSLFTLLSTLSFSAEKLTEEQKQYYAKLLANPIANLQIIPFQYNFNNGIGPYETGKQSSLKI